MDDTVGLLIGRRLLADTLAGRPSFEDVKFYVQAARRYGVELFLFSPAGIDKRRERIAGYVPRPRGGYARCTRPLPEVVYDRTSPRRRTTGAWLERRGVRVFNPPVRFDKYDAYRLLVASRTTREYVPETRLLAYATFDWFRSALRSGSGGRASEGRAPGGLASEVFVKPRAGSLGRGVCRFVALEDGRCLFEKGSRSTVYRSARAAWLGLRRGAGRKASRRLLQRGIELAEDRGRRFDLRVPVQKDRDGSWVVSAPRARRAGPVAYVTNVARGGTLHVDVRAVLERSLPSHDPDELWRRVEGAALDIASAVSRRYPLMADLGLDMGLDREGRPWLIEVNTRPLRYTVEGVGDWAGAYFAPIGYAAYLLERSRRPSLASIFYRRR